VLWNAGSETEVAVSTREDADTGARVTVSMIAVASTTSRVVVIEREQWYRYQFLIAGSVAPCNYCEAEDREVSLIERQEGSRSQKLTAGSGFLLEQSQKLSAG